MTELYKDVARPLEERARDLVAHFTLEEKLTLLPTRQAAVERLGVPAYKVGGEAAHGVAWKGVATVFPQPMGLSSTWNKELLREIGSVIGDEARSYHRSEPETHGLTLWAPTVDMERNPFWGRTEEAYGEDPHLTGKLTAALARGMQGEHEFYLKMVATLKHYFANNNEVGRLDGSSSVTPRNMREYYLEAFRIPFEEGGALSMMTAYNSINGTPAIESPYVQRFVKDEWKMDGFIVCDGGDLSQTVHFHKYHDSHAESVAGALLAGVDCLTDEPELVISAAREALERRLIGEEEIDRALVNIFRIRFRLGQFDPEADNPYAQIEESVLCAPEHAALAKRAAEQSVVLLKNDGLLPLRRAEVTGAAVVGPTADAVWTDWYSGTLPYRVSILDAVRAKLGGESAGRIGPDGEAALQAAAARTVAEANEAVRGEDHAARWLANREAPAAAQAGGAQSAAAAGRAAHSAVRYAEGSDTVRLRSAGSGGSLAVQPGEAGVLALGGAGTAARAFGEEEASPNSGAEAGEPASLFELTRWGWGQHTLRAHANGKFVTAQDGRPLAASAEQIGGWFVKELFDLEAGQDGETTLRQWNGAPLGWSEESRAAQAQPEDSGLRTLRALGTEGGAAAPLLLEVTRDGIEAAAAAARETDVAIVCVGNSPYINGKEEIDRPGLSLPPRQEELIRAVHDANPNTVVVIVGSYPFALGEIAELVPAIVYLAHGGQELGSAVADILFGDAAPAGRLSLTWYRSEDDLADMLDYDIIKSGATYQYFGGDPLYPFGHGLAYTDFRYGPLKLSGDGFGEEDTISIELEIENIGGADSDEVPQLYVRAGSSRVKRPLKQLKGFERLHIPAGETRAAVFELPVRELAFWDVTRDKFCVESGTYTLLAGASSADIRAEASVEIRGETVPPRSLYSRTRAENFDDYDNVLLDEGERSETSARPADLTQAGELIFRDVDLTRGLAGWKLRVRGGETAGRLELRLGGEDGKPLGVHDIAGAAEGEWSTLQGAPDESAKLPSQSAELRIVLHGSLRLGSLELIPAQ
ncbi:glycoside hydrolase family 3 C-terminal domain-containing protein [Saccharibacillus sp. CPCC 101409]|uniref:glycoside hydrolase family 3 C-terminal domain-containing protein n=1 Tax=Saccharibacillus sp. CPCC 101409 TaxID=3058041 RepID=UPI00267350AF|nr:glycoside hydrolase family 3 C-terminal domain-containing protein [Saccharibacillus sp. CPCC 101409]MDO3410778.1 glycoside hydrolase family 3 C-terminal domain-containing protein [Saccharibacillus sp. CPCC 101409]